MSRPLKKLFAILAGNSILALGIAAFIEPTGIITGGTAGVGLVFGRLLGVPVSVTAFVLNAAAFFLGLAVLGRAFALTTLVSSCFFPIVLGVFERIEALARITDDTLLCALLAGACSGLGVGIVLKAGASTGGLDIPPLVAQKLWALPIDTGMMALNCAVLALQLPFSGPEQILYGLVNTVLMSAVLGRVMTFGTQQIQILIISPRFEEIRCALLREDCGVTLLNAETGLTAAPQKAVLCVVHPRRLASVKDRVQAIDPQSFMTISTITEVHGKGFSLSR